MSRAKVEPSATASSDMLRIIRGAAAELGLELDRIYSGSGIDCELLDRPFARLPIHLARRAWTRTAAESGEPALGLRLASQMGVGALGVLDELLVTSPTLEEAFRRLGRF